MASPRVSTPKIDADAMSANVVGVAEAANGSAMLARFSHFRHYLVVNSLKVTGYGFAQAHGSCGYSDGNSRFE